MRLILLLLFACVAAGADAQPATPPISKLAVLSLIGDELTVDVYRERVGSSIDKNDKQVAKVDGPVFDHTALLAAAKAAQKLLPKATVAPLAVAKPGTGLDPNVLLADRAAIPGSAALGALRAQGFDHVLAISKYRGVARMKLADATVGSGYVQGIGFYVDAYARTKTADTGEGSQGLIAPYVYIKLSLLDLASGTVRKEAVLAESTTIPTAHDKNRLDPWAALTEREKAEHLQDMIRQAVASGTATVLEGR